MNIIDDESNQFIIYVSTYWKRISMIRLPPPTFLFFSIFTSKENEKDGKRNWKWFSFGDIHLVLIDQKWINEERWMAGTNNDNMEWGHGLYN